MLKIQIAPSMLASDFSCLDRELEKCASGGANLIHLDVMDGHFVPNISFGAPVISKLRPVCTLPFDVHLMISNPLKYAADFAAAGADIIVFHIESDSPAADVIDQIHALGCKAGIAVKPGTPVQAVFPYLERLSMVLVMTVEPGFGGQSFMADMMPKVRTLREECLSRKLELDIQVDGGITEETISAASLNGANVFVAGSAVFCAENPRRTIQALKETAAQSASYPHEPAVSPSH